MEGEDIERPPFGRISTSYAAYMFILVHLGGKRILIGYKQKGNIILKETQLGEFIF